MPSPIVPMWMAVHEAGHAVVADALGFRVLGTTSNADAISVQTFGAGSPYIDVVVAVAGAVAQERFGERRGPGSQDDLDIAADAAADYVGGGRWDASLSKSALAELRELAGERAKVDFVRERAAAAGVKVPR